jgi:glycosyltransferase involved in cell wall biosynthesis
MKLSICMMVKNEEKYLDDCLKSLKPLMNKIESELIIIDTGSTDNTIKIAKRYTDKVYFHPWNDDFATMRNISISYAKGEWLLIIDGDEILANTNPLVGFLKTEGINEYGAAFLILKDFLGQGESFSLSKVMRLFRIKDFKYTGSIHEKPQFKGKIKQLQAQITHYGYLQNNPKNIEEKYKRNIKILTSEIEKEPENVMLRYYMSTTSRLYGDSDMALKEAKKAYDISKKTGEEYPFIYLQLVMCLIEKNEYKKAEKISLEGIEKHPRHVDLYYCLAKILGLSKKYNLAIRYYTKYIELTTIAEQIILESSGDMGFLFLNRVEEVYIDLAIIYFEKNDYGMSLQYAMKINDDKHFKRAALIIKDIYRIYLAKNDISDESYLEVFEKYLQSGINYINTVYDKSIISNEKTEKIKCREDIFFMYMQKGLQQKDKEKLLDYIKNAVNVCPETRKGIKLLLKNL